MSLVTLVSGGLDSTLIGVLSREQGLKTHPLFIDYGQRAASKEWVTCQKMHAQHGLPMPTRMDISGFGRVIVSGLTSEEKAIKDDAFTPGRNLLFLVCGAAHAFQVQAHAIVIGLLSEAFSLFPDQRSQFLEDAERATSAALGKRIKVLAPLMDFTKGDVVRLAESKGIAGTYSCHAGTEEPCGKCISCLELLSS